MKNIIIGILVLGVAAFGYWTIAPLFITKEVNDELDPEIAALLEQTESQERESTITQREPEEPIPTRPATPDADGVEREITDADIADVSQQLAPEPEAESVAIETIEVEETGPSISAPLPIVDTPGHPASGNVRVIQTEDDTIVRFEDYDGTNGPDLFVYLAKDLDADEFVDLGRARGNMGNINYTVPDDVDISEYQYVMTWCRAFGVLFDYAEIN